MASPIEKSRLEKFARLLARLGRGANLPNSLRALPNLYSSALQFLSYLEEED